MNPFILKTPRVTEKTYKLQQQQHVYTFEVVGTATKGQIKEAVEQTFNVKVLSVQTSKLPGSTRRTGRKRMISTTQAVKKAMVRIPQNQTIEVFEIQS